MTQSSRVLTLMNTTDHFTVEVQMKTTKRNWVAKHGRRLHRARVFTDRKKASKRGYCKHKSHWS